jgi:hypothetical protein
VWAQLVTQLQSQGIRPLAYPQASTILIVREESTEQHTELSTALTGSDASLFTFPWPKQVIQLGPLLGKTILFLQKARRPRNTGETTGVSQVTMSSSTVHSIHGVKKKAADPRTYCRAITSNVEANDTGRLST